MLKHRICTCVCLEMCFREMVCGCGVKIFLTQCIRQGNIWHAGNKLVILILFGG